MPLKSLTEGSVVSNLEEKPGDRGRLGRTSGTSCIVLGFNEDNSKVRVKLPSGARKTLNGECRGTVGIIAGGGRTDKPLLKAGAAYHKYKCKRNCWPVVRGVARNPVEHPHGGGNHQHIGMPSTRKRSSAPGQKVGLIAARRTGLKKGGVSLKVKDADAAKKKK